MAQSFYISDLPAVAVPKTELPGGLLEVETKTGPAGSLQNKKLTLEQLAVFLATLGANANELPSLYKSVEFRTRAEQQQLFPALINGQAMSELKGETMALGTQIWVNDDPDNVNVYRVIYDSAGPLSVWTDGTFGASGRGRVPAKFVAVSASVAPTTPVAPTLTLTADRKITAVAAGYADADMEYRQGSGSFGAYPAGGVQIDNNAHVAGELQFRVKATGSRPVGATASSPAITAAGARSLTFTDSDFGQTAILLDNAKVLTNGNRRTSQAVAAFVADQATQGIFHLKSTWYPQNYTSHPTDYAQVMLQRDGQVVYVQATSSDCYVQANFPGSPSARPVTVVEGPQRRSPDDEYHPHAGTYVADIALVDGTSISRVAPVRSANVVYGVWDSIYGGEGTTQPLTKSVGARLRAGLNYDVVMDQAGGRSWKGRYYDDAAQEDLAARIKTGFTGRTGIKTALLALGPNDGSSTETTRIAGAIVDKIHRDTPDAFVVICLPTRRADGGDNSVQTQQLQALQSSGRSWLYIFDMTGYPTAGKLSGDDLHPDDDGDEGIANFLISRISGFSGEVPPAGFKGLVGPGTVLGYQFAEDGKEADASWQQANTGQPTPSGRVIYGGSHLRTVVYGKGVYNFFAPGGSGSGSAGVTFTRVSTGATLPPVGPVQQSQVNGGSQLMYSVDTGDTVVGWIIDQYFTGQCNFDRMENPA